VILGDQPALTPEQNLFQRMLAGDPDEAADQAERFMKEKSLCAYYDEIAIPGLLLARPTRDAELWTWSACAGLQKPSRALSTIFPITMTARHLRRATRTSMTPAHLKSK
jgi:hypothetical protein